jgi:hypothetical protein
MMKSFAQWCGAKSFTSMREVQMAQEAWDYQQDRIEELEAHVEYLMTECHRFTDKRLMELLEQRIIDLQGHDDLSYIDKKLSKQEGE